jgi:hypothetical protein
LQATVAPVFDLEVAAVPYEDIVVVLLQCVDGVCGSSRQQQQHQQQRQLRLFAITCLATMLLQECEDMCSAFAPMTLDTASVICTRIGKLRGQLMRGESDGGVALDVGVCLRSVAAAAVLTVTNARHAVDFVTTTASGSAAATAAANTPLMYSAKHLSSLSCAAALAADSDLFADNNGIWSFLAPDLPQPLTPASAKQFLGYRKDIRCVQPFSNRCNQQVAAFNQRQVAGH